MTNVTTVLLCMWKLTHRCFRLDSLSSLSKVYLNLGQTSKMERLEKKIDYLRCYFFNQNFHKQSVTLNSMDYDFDQVNMNTKEMLTVLYLKLGTWTRYNHQKKSRYLQIVIMKVRVFQNVNIEKLVENDGFFYPVIQKYG